MQPKETREQMFEQVKIWQDSGLSQKKFCEQANIPYHVFHYWYKVYRNLNQSASGSFVKLKLHPSLGSSSVELICSNGNRVLFHEAVSPEFLKALIS